MYKRCSLCGDLVPDGYHIIRNGEPYYLCVWCEAGKWGTLAVDENKVLTAAVRSPYTNEILAVPGQRLTEDTVALLLSHHVDRVKVRFYS